MAERDMTAREDRFLGLCLVAAAIIFVFIFILIGIRRSAFAWNWRAWACGQATFSPCASTISTGGQDRFRRTTSARTGRTSTIHESIDAHRLMLKLQIFLARDH
jgi:hypothetical protein